MIKASPEFTSAMAEIAREAGALLMRYFGQVSYEYKGDVDLVTVADREAEELIVNRLHARWPQHDIVGEEGTRTERGSDYRWFVDPLDGTTNFAHGYPVFCVSLGLQYKGEPVAGVLYDPTRDELFQAEKGSGAYLNSRRMRVSKTQDLSESLVATGFPSHKRHKNPNIHFYHQVTLRTHGIRRGGSAALDLAYVACGRYDAFWEFNLNAWDTCGGVVLVREAGGLVSGMRNEPFAGDQRDVLASNGLVHAAMVTLLADIFAGRNLEPLPSIQEHGERLKV